MWHDKVDVESTFADRSTQWAWAKLSGLGWRRIKDGAPDGCTNLLVLVNAAKANGREVKVEIDEDNLITTAYLL